MTTRATVRSHSSHSMSSPPSPHHAQQHQGHAYPPTTTQYGQGPPSPGYSTTSSSSQQSRRSSVCIPTAMMTETQPHRRSRSFREPPRSSSSRYPGSSSSSSTINTTTSFEMEKKGGGGVAQSGPPSAKSKRALNRPPPLNCFSSTAAERSMSTTSSVSTATTAFFNTSTESSGSGTTGRFRKTNPSTPSSSASNWSMSSEYSTTSSMSKRESRERVAAAGGKLAYLASRRGSSGSVTSSGCSTPPNTPGGGGGVGTGVAYTRMGGAARRQSSGNFLEVPTNPSAVVTDPQQARVSPATSPTGGMPPGPPSSFHPQCSRPRVNSLPANSLTPQLLSPTYIPAQYQHHSTTTTTPYNPRSTITKSQDYLYRLRTFNITAKGVVNCGDKVCVRRSKSNNCISEEATSPRKYSLNTSPTRSQRSVSPCRRGSLSPRLVIMSPLLDPGCCVPKEFTLGSDDEEDDAEDEDCGGFDDDEEELTMREFAGLVDPPVACMKYRVVLLGESGVGKSALVRQFMTSEYINTYDMSLDEEYGEREVSVLLDSKESQLVFIDHPCIEMSVENSLATYEPHACVVVYSVTDRRSFEFAGEVLRYLWQEGTTHERSVILVGNKCDLARVRVISTQEGKQLATSHDTKFIETSSGIQHNVDELLVGVLKQIRLREEANGTGGGGFNESVATSNRCKERQRGGGGMGGATTPRGSIMGLLFTRELINKLCFLSNKAKSCENLHVL